MGEGDLENRGIEVENEDRWENRAMKEGGGWRECRCLYDHTETEKKGLVGKSVDVYTALPWMVEDNEQKNLRT